jgi:hypothetical protein
VSTPAARRSTQRMIPALDRHTEVAAFGRRVAAELGVTVAGREVDWFGYGSAARNAIGKGRPVPPVERFANERAAAPGKTIAQCLATPRTERIVWTPETVVALRELRILTRLEGRRALGLPVRLRHHLMFNRHPFLTVVSAVGAAVIAIWATRF